MGSLDVRGSPLWADLVATALLGSDRRPPALPPGPGRLGELLGRLAPAEDPAGALLGAAAAVALYQRAGWNPPAGGAQPFTPAPPDDLPSCSARSGGHLAKMLFGSHRAALPEWLAALAASRRSAPPALLAALLDRGQAEEELRPAVLGVLGARGRWLAGLNPGWGYAAIAGEAPGEQDAGRLWETGSRATRLALLGQLRGESPGPARDLLAATWATEKADERAAFLATFASGLSLADEPFLERALDDRSERVRKAAALLLAALPQSGLIARMAARLAPLLSWKPGRLLQRPSIAVALPEEYDGPMQRDGVARKPVSAALGERAWWLNQMLELVPPATWSGAWQAAPNEILAARMPKEWRGLLLVSWAEAARRHGDQAWLEALVALARAGESALALAELLPALPPARREELVGDLLAGGGELTGDHPALAALRSLPGVWGHRLARAALGALKRRFRAGDAALRSDWHLRATLDLLAARIPADMADEAAATFPDAMRELPYWGEAITQFESLLWFRYEMLAALRES